MKNKILNIGILITIIILFCGCIDNKGTVVDKEKGKFIGTWKTNQDLTLIFYEDDTCRMEGLFNGPGEWYLENNTIFITLKFEGGKNYMSYNYSFSDDENTLILTDSSGRAWIYHKQS